jgi:hypothetical protein
MTLKSGKVICRRLAVALILLTIIAMTLPPLSLALAQSSEGTDAYQLLIAGPRNYQDSIQRFIDFKKSQGISAHFVSTEDINSTISNGNFVLGLHDYIAQEVKQSGIKYLIIVGNYDQVPTKYVYSPSNDLEIADFNYKPTDWYYSVPDWSDSQIGLLGGNVPQIAVGRLPVKNIQELEQTLSKIISVEENLGAGSFVSLQDPNLGADSDLNVPHSTISFNTNLTSNRLAEVLSENVSYAVSYTHGTPSGLWTQIGTDQWAPLFSSKDVASLKSTFGIMYTVACFTGAIDLKEDGLARALITSPAGPALVIASSRTESLSSYIPSAFWDKFFETGNVGDSFVFSLQSYLSDSAVFSSDSKAFQKYNFYLDKVIYGDVSWSISNMKAPAPVDLGSSTQPNAVLLNALEERSQNEGNVKLSGLWMAFPFGVIFLSCALAVRLWRKSRNGDNIQIGVLPEVFVISSESVSCQLLVGNSE